MTKITIPKGTRDFSPSEMRRRNFIFDTIRAVYQLFGFEQIETPSMENLSTLEGKYGDEGDKLLFRILNSGIVVDNIPIPKNRIVDFENNKGSLFTSDVPASELIKPSEFTKYVSEKGLRYDLTVPLARYVVNHQNEITFPFKRYQIQPVWRADRPQKGRYREFYQCDADVIGSDSLLNEVELIQIIDEVFSTLNIKVKIKINNRKILFGLAKVWRIEEKFFEFVAILDKCDKIGVDHTLIEISRFTGIPSFPEYLRKSLFLQPTHKIDIENIFNELKENIDNDIGQKGIKELEEIFLLINKLGQLKSKLSFDITLARGLNYYTGAIIEVKIDDPNSTFTSSICGGGRYDDLTGIFGLPNVSGVGISFGADRIYDVLEEMKGFPDFSSVSTQLLFVNFGETEAAYCINLASQLRKQGVNTEVYPDPAKIKKQMSYAETKKIPFVALVGSEEMNKNIITIKDMNARDQFTCGIDEIVKKLRITV